jgi:hypothetical protein
MGEFRDGLRWPNNIREPILRPWVTTPAKCKNLRHHGLRVLKTKLLSSTYLVKTL